MDKDSVVLLDQVYTIPKVELWAEWYMGRVTDFDKIDRALIYYYGDISKMFGKILEGYLPNYLDKFSRK